MSREAQTVASTGSAAVRHHGVQPFPAKKGQRCREIKWTRNRMRVQEAPQCLSDGHSVNCSQDASFSPSGLTAASLQSANPTDCLAPSQESHPNLHQHQLNKELGCVWNGMTLCDVCSGLVWAVVWTLTLMCSKTHAAGDTLWHFYVKCNHFEFKRTMMWTKSIPVVIILYLLAFTL